MCSRTESQYSFKRGSTSSISHHSLPCHLGGIPSSSKELRVRKISTVENATYYICHLKHATVAKSSSAVETPNLREHQPFQLPRTRFQRRFFASVLDVTWPVALDRMMFVTRRFCTLMVKRMCELKARASVPDGFCVGNSERGVTHRCVAG